MVQFDATSSNMVIGRNESVNLTITLNTRSTTEVVVDLMIKNASDTGNLNVFVI